MKSKTVNRKHKQPLEASYLIALLLLAIWVFGGCSPRVEVTPSDKPITINMNVKIDHEVRVKVDKDLDQVISKDSPLF